MNKEKIKEFIATLLLSAPWALVFKVFFIELSKNHQLYESNAGSWIIAITGFCLMLHILFVKDVARSVLGWGK